TLACDESNKQNSSFKNEGDIGRKNNFFPKAIAVNNRLSGMRFDRPDNKFSGKHDLLTKRGNKETINE
ncbi:hypothetical protein BpHYR1_007156, partial [Brachionus plicatilis]